MTAPWAVTVPGKMESAANARRGAGGFGRSARAQRDRLLGRLAVLGTPGRPALPVVVALVRTGWDLEANTDAYDRAEYWAGRGLPGHDAWFGIYLHVVRLGEQSSNLAIIPDATIDTGGYGLES